MTEPPIDPAAWRERFRVAWNSTAAVSIQKGLAYQPHPRKHGGPPPSVAKRKSGTAPVPKKH